MVVVVVVVVQVVVRVVEVDDVDAVDAVDAVDDDVLVEDDQHQHPKQQDHSGTRTHTSGISLSL